MELFLERMYHPQGTNGTICTSDRLVVCLSIELPWCSNLTGVSCISEGRYELVSRYSPRHGKHFLLKDVPGRSLILIHPANDALKELRGCIAPVLKHTGEGKGSSSKIAMKQLSTVISNALIVEPVYLTIKCWS